jgi:hypothetical protein
MAVIITRESGPRFGSTTRLALFLLAAIVAGAIVLAIEFNGALGGQML